ncbi:DNA methyltransferase [uncultured Sphaerotilus sp.]|uniref:class I SAM-dependent DNA methyltransferase n=1 Tax=uncultured Sphaerotilus sp. TaxID=474984 RepID=UPI0030CA5213
MSSSPPATSATTPAAIQSFIDRWTGVTASELSTSQSFIIDLCELLDVPRPHPTPERDYMFERPVTFQNGDGSTSPGRVDCYRRGAYVWESKKLNPGAQAAVTGKTTRSFDNALLLARTQAEYYARALPASEGRPPFVVVVDVGHVFELYAEFSRSGSTYTPYPDARSHRIRLADLHDPAIRARLRALWVDPMSLDPSRISARVTRAVSAELAELAKSLEDSGHAAQQVAGFLTRCLFTMFAEDVGLLPADEDGLGAFVSLLTRWREQPERLTKMLQALWATMDSGGFSPVLAQDVMRFNGKLFKGAGQPGYVLPLTTGQIDGLLRAAKADWREVEPAIFGTLLERALSTTERHALGAHYTPRAYVERLVMPTVIEPLRAEWALALGAALVLAAEAEALDGKKREDKLAEARAELRRFHHRLCHVRVLDPACGSGNFLYVTLEHLKRLEGEVLDRLEALGESTQGQLAMEGGTVTLKQMLGIELNPRAAALAELVLWIGWLQWQIRTGGSQSVAEPVVHDYGNIQCRDAVLAYDRQELATDADGRTVTRWDGKTTKVHPVTGEKVPDEAAQVPEWRYVNPRQAEWPQAEFIVGNPPFIGAGPMRLALGDGYTQTLRATWPEVPESADFVMYWWHQAAQQVRTGRVERFGFITTNSLRQTFNRRVIEQHLNAKEPLTLAFAVPDHPWVDSAHGAAVRIAMSVGTAAAGEGRLLTVTAERGNGQDEIDVQLEERRGVLHADLRVGANVASTKALAANGTLTSRGVMLFGAGFIVTNEEASLLGLGKTPGLDRHIRSYRNGRDLTDKPRGVMVIDLFGLSAEAVRTRFPAVYQWINERVKPERDANRDPAIRSNWWLHGRSRGEIRLALANLPHYIATVETAKHRVFQFLDTTVLPDNKLIAIALSGREHLGVLSSVVHVTWALASGSRLGVGNDPVYVKTRCFETFPFPEPEVATANRISKLAEELDAFRKARQAAHESVTLTGMYNVLDKLRREEPLNAKDKALHEQALVGVLRTLHDALDAAVLDAYGWQDLGPVPWTDEEARQAWTERLLERLVDLNTRRAAEEARGTIRWLRPAFQDPTALKAEPQSAIELVGGAPAPEADTEDEAPATPAAPAARQPWPADLPAQMRAVADALSTSAQPLDEDALASRFTGRGPWKKRLPQILETLVVLGKAQREAGGRWRGA